MGTTPYTGVRQFKENNPNMILIGHGHTHSNDGNISNAHTPSGPYLSGDGSLQITDPVDYRPLDITNPFTNTLGGNPSFLSTTAGYSIYPTVINTGNQWDGQTLLNHGKRVYDFNGNNILIK